VERVAGLTLSDIGNADPDLNPAAPQLRKLDAE
jgi:hypothetical protein